jgi:Na+-driven multidrug efflux pump
MGPLFLELCLGISVGLVGTALAARSGDEAAAAFALGNHVASLLFILLRVVGAGISVVVSQQLGAGPAAAAEDTARAVLGAGLWTGIATAAVAVVGAPWWMQLLSAPAEVAPAAIELLRWLAVAFVLDALLTAQTSVLRSHLQARPTLLLVVAMHGTHLVLAALLMPTLGLLGFAWALLASRMLAVVGGAWLWRRLLGLRTRAPDLWRWRWGVLQPVVAVGAPAAAENLMYRMCHAVSIMVAGQLGAAALATQAYVLQINTLSMLLGLAIGLSMEILVGHLVGARALREAHRLVLRALAAGLTLSVAVAGLMAWSGASLMVLFTQDASIAAAGITLLAWTILLEPGRTFNLVVINALRAAGDVRYPVMAGAVSMVVVLGGGSWWLGLHLGWGLPGVWIAYAADEWVRGLLMWRRWHSGAWLPFARRSIRALA